MELSSEDSLRLNVLLAQKLQAVRIDESRMVVYALSELGEAKVPLHPNCKDELYLRRVRQLLSTYVLGSPGGYPVYLKRWSRMGQTRDQSLEKLLLLGEPEAISAVVHAPGLTEELARRAWWADSSAETARRLLERPCVAKGKMGSALADYLVEYLPFEQDHQAMIESIRLMLQPELIDERTRDQLWARCKRKNTYYLGFLKATPDDLPLVVKAHTGWLATKIGLQPLINSGNAYAIQLCRCLSGAGQAFLQITESVLRKPVNQDVVVAILETIGGYFKSIRVDDLRRRDIGVIEQDVTRLFDGTAERPTALREVLDNTSQARDQFRAMVVLSMYSEQLVAPIFGLTDAIGSVMRKKIAPITEYTFKQLALLTSAGD